MKIPFVFDIDDVLCDCSNAVRSIYNKQFGVNLGPAQHYSTVAAFPEIGPEGAKWFTETYVDGKIMGSLPVIRSARNMANEIAKDFQVYYATHRPATIQKETVRWLKRKDFPDGNISFGYGCKRALRETIRGPMIFIDDSGENLESISTASEDQTLLLCVTMPHNENFLLPDGTIRISNYKQIPIVARQWKEKILG